MGWRFCQSMEGWFPNVLNFVVGLARRDIATATAGGQQLVLCPLCPWLPSTFKAAGLLFKALYIYTYICILDIMIPVADYSAWNREWLVFRPEYCRSVWIPTILERFSPSCALFQLQQPLGWVEFLLPIYCKPFFPANLRCNAARKGLTMVPEAGLGMERFLSVSCSERRFSSMKSDNMWQPSFFIFFQQAIHTCSFPVKALAVMSWRGPPCRVNTHEARSVSFGPDMFGQWNQLINSSATQSH